MAAEQLLATCKSAGPLIENPEFVDTIKPPEQEATQEVEIRAEPAPIVQAEPSVFIEKSEYIFKINGSLESLPNVRIENAALDSLLEIEVSPREDFQARNWTYTITGNQFRWLKAKVGQYYFRTRRVDSPDRQWSRPSQVLVLYKRPQLEYLREEGVVKVKSDYSSVTTHFEIYKNKSVTTTASASTAARVS